MGPPGPPGPKGPPGPGRPVFAGYTPLGYTGDLGGFVGANAKCDAAFPGSSFCTIEDYYLSEPDVAPGPAGAWMDDLRSSAGERSLAACYKGGPSGGAWTLATADGVGPALNARGNFFSTSLCSYTHPIACCYLNTNVLFRGFTNAGYTGELGGFTGANAKCRLDFPGSYFCTAADYSRAEPTVSTGGMAVWVDTNRDTDASRRSTASCYSTTHKASWSENADGPMGLTLNPAGYGLLPALCTGSRKLACCENK